MKLTNFDSAQIVPITKHTIVVGQLRSSNLLEVLLYQEH